MSPIEPLQAAHLSWKNGQTDKAIQQLIVGLEDNDTSELLLSAIVQLYFAVKTPLLSIEYLIRLNNLFPDKLDYAETLVSLYLSTGERDSAYKVYLSKIDRSPKNPLLNFNLAWLYKKTGAMSLAIEHYRAALSKNISQCEEVYSNLGLIYFELGLYSSSKLNYLKALHHNPSYRPAILNLASLEESRGKNKKAKILYWRCLELYPDEYIALNRLANLPLINSQSLQLVQVAKKILEIKKLTPEAKESTLFSLAKLYDNVEEFDQSFDFYTLANNLSSSRFKPYISAEVENQFSRIKSFYSNKKTATHTSSDLAAEQEVSPIFICGMFRSGTTLVEQILSTFSDFNCCGELPIIKNQVKRYFLRYPDKIKSTHSKLYAHLAKEYTDSVEENCTGVGRIVDKMPDNFIYCGLIKKIFPKAKFIFLKRNKFDVALSVYFHQFSGELNYSNSIKNTLHYIDQAESLMDYWESQLNQDVLTLNYEDIVNESECAIKNITKFLDLTFDLRALEFYKSKNLVKTASVHQVRKSLYKTSIQKHMNYPKFLAELETCQS